MADDKKPSGPSGIAPSSQVVSELSFFLVGLLLLGYVLARLYAYINSLGPDGWNSLIAFLYSMWPIFKILAVLVSIGAVVWMTYIRMKTNEVVREELKIYGADTQGSFLADLKEEMGQEPLKKENEKWEKVVGLANSQNPSDWRLAIIEADVMLEEYLRKAGYHGDSVGDMLKSVEPGEIIAIEAAWEAHKVRNRIAHSGGDFQLNDRDTRRVISLFEAVFQEFGII